MTHPIPVHAPAEAAPELRVAPPSLAAALPTAMALVDYALGGEATPTPEPQAVAVALSSDLVSASHPVRAALAHGTSLRAYLLTTLSADHPAHRDWPALRRWLAGLADDAVHRLLAYGVADVLGYRKPPGTTPTASEVGATGESLTRHAVAVLAAWRVDGPEHRAAELGDPAGVRAALLELLDAVWDGWLAADWPAQLPGLRAAAGAAPAPPPAASGAHWITLVTGLRPDPRYAEIAEAATRVTVMPCPGLGRSLSLFRTDPGHAWVLHTPGEQPAPPGLVRAGISVQRLGRLAPALHALGDRTRLAIVLHLLAHGPLAMAELADALRVHQSTVSRQVAALRRALLVRTDDQRRLVVDRATLIRTADTLREAAE